MDSQWVEKMRNTLELHIFGVCQYLGDKLQMPAYRIRLFFVYATFIATWSPVIIYLAFAFILNLRQYIKRRKTSIWDL